MVFNTMAWPRTETVQLSVQLPEGSDDVHLTDAKNEPILSQVISHDAATHSFKVLAQVKSVPAIGYEVIHAEKGKHGEPASSLHVEEQPGAFVLSNGQLKLAIDRKSGCITSLSSGGHETLASGACGNQLQTFKDTPKQYDAWNIDPWDAGRHDDANRCHGVCNARKPRAHCAPR